MARNGRAHVTVAATSPASCVSMETTEGGLVLGARPSSGAGAHRVIYRVTVLPGGMLHPPSTWYGNLPVLPEDDGEQQEVVRRVTVDGESALLWACGWWLCRASDALPAVLDGVAAPQLEKLLDSEALIVSLCFTVDAAPSTVVDTDIIARLAPELRSLIVICSQSASPQLCSTYSLSRLPRLKWIAVHGGPCHRVLWCWISRCTDLESLYLVSPGAVLDEHSVDARTNSAPYCTPMNKLRILFTHGYFLGRLFPLICFPNLQHFYVTRVLDSSRALSTLVSTAPSLQRLELHGCYKFFLADFSSTHGLTHLSIFDCINIKHLDLGLTVSCLMNIVFDAVPGAS